jgi:excisionase family DNA binding protein
MAAASTIDAPDLLTVEEVAQMLRLTRKGVYSMVEARRIPFVRVSNRVRFLRCDVLRWLERQRVEPVDFPQ